MVVFRLCKDLYKHDLSGRGAELVGGRWNSKGIAMLYTSESRALCTTEIAAHTPLGILPTDFVLIAIDIPDSAPILEIKLSELPHNWNALPFEFATQKMGDKFIKENKFLAFKVPSVVVPGDFNYLINPFHKDFNKVAIVKIVDFKFDKRLFK